MEILPDGAFEIAGLRFRLCLFSTLTGIACPGCGMTRAVLAFLTGNFAASFRYHPLALPVLAQAAVLGASMLGPAWTRWRLHRQALGGNPSRSAGEPTAVAGFQFGRGHKLSLIGLGCALLIVWLVRWQTGTLPPV